VPNIASMEGPKGPLGDSAPGRLIERRVERKGLRPQLAAAVIAVLWLIAIVVFGVVIRLVDPDSFDTIWDGMWWATQTVTTVGYGDIVPEQAGGQVIGAVLMIAGLSFFAVITGVITSAFVTRAQEARRAQRVGTLEQTIDRMARDIHAMREQLTRERGDGGAGPSGG
jgi:voltage-gated potassium channel